MINVMRRWAWIFIAVFLLFSCSDTGFLLTPSPEVFIETPSDGTVFNNTNAQIPARIINPNKNIVISLIKIELFDSEGNIIANQELSGPFLDDNLPAVDLSSYSEGFYSLRYTLYDEDNQQVLYKESKIFLVEKLYKLLGISIYPPVLYPGGSGILYAALDVPENSDPYLRWSIGDSLLAEGLLSENLNSIIWNSPEKEGVYKIRVELFPLAPPRGSSYPFTSSEVLTADIFVTANQETSKRELSPDKHYYSLFHFRGEYRDYGYRESKKGLAPLGTPHLEVRGNSFGYYLDGSSGFSSEEFLLPVINGRLGSFSLSLRMDIENTGEKGIIFYSESPFNNFSFSLGVSSDGYYEATVKTPSLEYTSNSYIPLSLNVVTLTVLPGTSELEFRWYEDGRIMAAETLPYFGMSFSNASGISRIGGPGGISGIIDELGVFYRQERDIPSYDYEVFKTARRKEYGNSLIYAEGFDGLLISEPLQVSGKYILGGSRLILEENSSLSIKLETAENEDYLVSLTGFNGQGLIEISHPEMDKPVLTLLNEKPIVNSNDLVLIINREASSLMAMLEDETYTESLGDYKGKELLISFQAIPGTGAILSLEDISVIRTGRRVSKKETSSPVQENAALIITRR